MEVSSIINELKLIIDNLNIVIRKYGYIDNQDLLDIRDNIEKLNELIEEESIKGIYDSTIDLTVLNTKIDKYGIGKEVYELYKSGMSLKEISKVISKQTLDDIKVSEIESWLKNYTESSVTNRDNIIKGSVFDTRNRMEDLFELLLTQIEDIKTTEDDYYLKARTTKHQVIIEASRELRQLYKQAQELIEKVEVWNSMKVFQDLVLDALKDESPLVYTKVVSRLNKQRSLYTSIGLN